MHSVHFATIYDGVRPLPPFAVCLVHLKRAFSCQPRSGASMHLFSAVIPLTRHIPLIYMQSCLLISIMLSIFSPLPHPFISPMPHVYLIEFPYTLQAILASIVYARLLPFYRSPSFWLLPFLIAYFTRLASPSSSPPPISLSF